MAAVMQMIMLAAAAKFRKSAHTSELLHICIRIRKSAAPQAFELRGFVEFTIDEK